MRRSTLGSLAGALAAAALLLMILATLLVREGPGAPVAGPPLFIVRGRVVDGSRMPVQGARVALERPGAEPRTATTAADGSFLLDAEALGSAMTLRVSRAGLAPSVLEDIESVAGGTDVGLVSLGPACVLRGRVTDPDGNALPAASVFVLSGAPAGAELRPLATSDAAGCFEIGGLGVGGLRFCAEGGRFASASPETVELEAGRTVERDLRLERKTLFAGSVVDREGRALRGGRVDFVTDRSRVVPPVPAVYTDDSGRFEIRGPVKPGSGDRLRFARMGYAPVGVAATEFASGRRIELSTAPLVMVRASRDLRPIPIRSLRYEVSIRTGEGWRRENGVPAPGTYEVVEASAWKLTLPSLGLVRISCVAADGASKSSEFSEILSTGGADGAFHLVFEPCVRVKGIVRSPDGATLAHVKVRLAGGSDVGIHRASFTDGAGRFSFVDVPPGVLSLCVEDDSWASGPVSVVASKDGEGKDVELSAVKASRIRGRHLLSGEPPGEELPIAVYRLEDSPAARTGPGREGTWSRIAVVTAGASGDYEVPGLLAGRYALVPKKPLDPRGGAFRSFASEFPGKDLREWPHKVIVPLGSVQTCDIAIEAYRRSWLRGIVRVNGRPREGVNLTLGDAGGAVSLDGRTDTQGRFGFDLDRGGAFTLRLSAAGIAESRKVEVPDDSSLDMNLDVFAGSVRGLLLDPAGRPRKLRVRLERRRPDVAVPPRRNLRGEDEDPYESLAEVESDAEGRYSFETVPTLPCRVYVTDPAGVAADAASKPFTLGTGERKELAPIVVPPSAGIRVTVTSDEGKAPFSAVRVLAPPGAPELPKTWFVWTGDGNVLIRGVRPGPVLLQLHVYGPFEAPDQTVVLPSDGTETAVTFAVKRKA